MPTTPTLSPLLIADHRACDDLLATAETHVQAKRWPEAEAAWQKFESATLCHFAREEELLFPAFEKATGHRGGPTVVMRMEHDQMRVLFATLAAAVRERDARRFLGQSESLMLLNQQHNMKEEQMLYPMCDQAIPDQDALRARIEARRADQG